MTRASHLRYAARSDVGLRRPGNEDSGLADRELLMVADGMGGHAAGELASAMAVATFAELADEGLADEELLDQLADGVELLSERIGDVIAADPSNQGMGTTVTGLAWQDTRIAVVHVGDSRAYLLRDGVLAQITKDHTYVQSLVDAGEITAEEATRHPRRNLLNRAVDGIHRVEADLSVRETRPGDRFLLCTDGLSGVVPDKALADVLTSVADPTGAVTRLVDMALEAGAPDNVTVVVADVVADHGNGGERDAVVVGAAGEPANRARLPNVPWPSDEQPDPDHLNPRSDYPAPAKVESPTDTVPVQRQPGRPAWLTAAVAILSAVVALFALLGVALTWWLSQQWYVAESDGNVVVYHGVQGTLGPVPLQRVEQVTDLMVSSLPSYDQDRLRTGIDAQSLDSAQGIVSDLRTEAYLCQVNPKRDGCPAPPAQNDPPNETSDSQPDGETAP